MAFKTATRTRPAQATATENQYAPSFLGKLFKNDDPEKGSPYSGKMSITREDLVRLVAYLQSDSAELDRDDNYLFYINAYPKEPQTGTKKYLFVTVKPPAKAVKEFEEANSFEDDDQAPF